MPSDQANDLSRKLAILYEVGRELAAIRDPDVLLQQVARLTRRLVDYRTFAVLLMEPDGRLAPRIAVGLDKEFLERIPSAVDAGRLRALGRLQKPLLIQGALRDAHALHGLLDDHPEIRSEILLPLVHDGEMTGLLDIGTAGRSELTEEGFALLKAMGVQVAAALANVRLSAREARLREENLALRREIARKYRFDQLVGDSPRMRRVFELMEKVIPTTSTVLIEGETGTGKELVARAVHYSGPRKERRFLAQNCAALPEPLLESELFGHKKGAFTGASYDKKGLFELADGGTIFLDEVGDTPPAMQAKLLRVLQGGEIRPVGSAETKKVDVRIIAATNRDLEVEVREGRFRKDLYFRLRVFPIRLPPLRERQEDIPGLVRHFVGRFSQEFGKDIRGVSPEALASLQAYRFPGNVRELENEMERAVTLADPGCWIGPAHLSDAIREAAVRPAPAGGRPLRGRLQVLERELIETALAECAGNVSAAARALGISRQWLTVRMKKYGLAKA
jgi:transcriptional regulator with GAF, ATPase, and Fis domain